MFRHRHNFCRNHSRPSELVRQRIHILVAKRNNGGNTTAYFSIDRLSNLPG
jgi:hypothetical protein